MALIEEQIKESNKFCTIPTRLSYDFVRGWRPGSDEKLNTKVFSWRWLNEP